MLLVLAALPGLFWEGGADTAQALREAGIDRIQTPQAQVAAWKDVAGIKAEAADLRSAVKLRTPTVNYRMDQASASRAPWLDTNGWRFLRQPHGHFYYDVQGPQAALAAAEAFCYSSDAMIRTDAAGLKPLGQMLAFLHGVQADEMPAIADIGFQDDGTPVAGEVMNMMVRDNLLFRIVAKPDPSLKLTVRIGSKEYPLENAKNPGAMAHDIRFRLTDDKRSVRVYGSAVVVTRVTGTSGKLRVELLNYAASNRKVDGIRVRVLGKYPQHRVTVADVPQAELLDFTTDEDATEFTVPELKSIAVIDLSR